MKPIGIARMFAACMLLCGVSAACAEDAAPQNYAVISLIGDSLLVSPFNGALPLRINRSERRLDQNMYITLAVESSGLDDIALGEIAAAVRQRRPEVALDVLRARNSGLYKLQEKLFEATDASRASREALKNVLKERNANYLIVVTKHRTDKAEMLGDAHMLQDANLRLLKGASSDVVKREGLGFYIDDRVRLQSLKTLDFSNGALASYVDATLWLVDAKTLAVIREVGVTKSEIVAVSRPLEVGFNAWDEATMEQKMKSLQHLIGLAMAEAIPRVLGTSTP